MFHRGGGVEHSIAYGSPALRICCLPAIERSRCRVSLPLRYQQGGRASERGSNGGGVRALPARLADWSVGVVCVTDEFQRIHGDTNLRKKVPPTTPAMCVVATTNRGFVMVFCSWRFK